MERQAWSFDKLIAPHRPADFFDGCWEKEFLHIRRNQPGLFDGLFSLADIESWLHIVPGGETASVLVVPPEGGKEAGREYRPREIGAGDLYDAFSKGSSLVLNGLENTWPALAPLVESLGATFCANIGVNAYLTPKGSQTFNVHLDNHDVFVLQVYGTKDWRLHEYQQLPIRNLEFRRDLNFPNYWSRPGEAPLLEELYLEAGDLLYIPRGMPHCAVAKDRPSLHLTVSINPRYWLDLMKAALEQACFAVPVLRETLPPNFVSDPAIRDRMRDRFTSAMEALWQTITFDDSLRVLLRRSVRDRGFPMEGHLEELLRLGELAVDSVVERRENILSMVEFSDEYKFALIRFGTAHVRGPRKLKEALEFIRDHGRFRVGNLPGLDGQSQVVLVRRLIREGLLRFARADWSGLAGQTTQGISRRGEAEKSG